jgi:hypothetical protein
VDRHRLDDAAPYIYATHDFGKTWGKVTKGIPDGAYVRAVREAPSRRGLLFAATELGVYFSVDDGNSWQSLRLNMPVAPVHDLAIKDNDLIAATHGRAFWILDDFSPLSQVESTNINGASYLFAPAPALRIRSNVNNDTPLPPEVPAGENPPPGAILYYYLKSPAQGEVTLEIQDSNHKPLRRFSSSDQPFEPKPTSYAFPSYWFRPPEKIVTGAGVHRFVWDLRYPTPAVPHPEFGMNTAAGQSTPVEPLGALVLPGTYYVKLDANGKSSIQRLVISMDPRVKTSAEDLQKQFDLEIRIDNALQQGNAALDEIRAFYAQNKNNPAIAQKLQALSRIEPATPEPGPRRPDKPPTPTLSLSLDTLGRLAVTIDSADAAPTAQATKGAEATMKQLQGLISQWEKLKH